MVRELSNLSNPVARWRVRALLALALGIVMSCLLASCGNEEQQQPPLTVGQTLDRAMAAFADGDAAGLCRVLSRRAKIVLGHAQHGSPPLECREDVRPFLDSFRPYGNGFVPRLMRVERPAEDRARALYRLPAGMRATIPLSRSDGEWRLDGIFDATLSRIQVRSSPSDQGAVAQEEDLLFDTAIPDRSKVGGRVDVRSLSDGRRCMGVQMSRFPKLSGGCVLELSGSGIRITLQTPFGFMQLARCEVSFDLRVDGTGVGWIENYEIGGDSPCFDIIPCADIKQQLIPWRARVLPGSRAPWRLLVSSLCLDTCLGRFTGRWDVRLAESRRGWRIDSNSVVGSSGWRIDGGVAATRAAIAVRAGR